MLENRLISLLRKTKPLTTKFSSSVSTTQSRLYSLVPAKNSIAHGSRSMHWNYCKDLNKISFRNFSSEAVSLTAKNGDGLKLLVTAGPHARKAVCIWLLASAACVFSMVVLGGVTRLTRSGLSMTDWKFTGSLPPMSDCEWLIEFENYKQSPEYKRINKEIRLAEFKFIYWMEYAHRMWGRALGVMFAVPFSYFLCKRYITRQLGLKLSGLFALGAGPGLIGWGMVKSGLEEPQSEYSESRVSPYRLAANLTSAFVIYYGLLWTSLSVVAPEPSAESLAWVRGSAKVRRLALPVSIVVGITAVSAAFVAGNDAGRAFNTFPKIRDEWIPDDILILKPVIAIFLRIKQPCSLLVTATFVSICGLWWSTKKLDIHPEIRSLIRSIVGVTALQAAAFGILTRPSYVRVEAVQAICLLTLMILLNHMVRRPSAALLKTLPAVVKTTCKTCGSRI